MSEPVYKLNSTAPKECNPGDPISTPLVAALNAAAQKVHAQPSEAEALRVILRCAAQALPTFEHVGITLIVQREALETGAATSALVETLDAVQYEHEEGPGYDSLTGAADLVTVPSLSREERWPDYVRAAAALGVRSQMALRLHLDGKGTVGGLSFYSTSGDHIADDDVTWASLFATHAALALDRARDHEEMSRGLLGRQDVGAGIGILMERHGLTRQSARDHLWRTSSQHNIKVRDLAQRLIAQAEEASSPRK